MVLPDPSRLRPKDYRPYTRTFRTILSWLKQADEQKDPEMRRRFLQASKDEAERVLEACKSEAARRSKEKGNYVPTWRFPAGGLDTLIPAWRLVEDILEEIDKRCT